MRAMSGPIVTVMVLAHNEERSIHACLESILAAEPGARVEAYVMANGCTDRTEDIVREYSRRRPEVRLVTLAVADKCDAWNVFVHRTVPETCPGRETYFFMNGDARVMPGSFSAMTRALRSHPAAHAASAVPASGRNRLLDRQRILAEHGLVANLYGLRGGFVERLRRQSVRMPLNLEGDDGLLSALIKWDLAPDSNELDDARIVPCADAAFAFDSLSPLRPADWTLYWRRLVRYGRRGYEFQLLGQRLRRLGIAGLPADIVEVYPRTTSLRLRWQGIYTISNLVALRYIERMGGGRDGKEAASPPLPREPQ
jgi:glycosyltransferase involved in cell wall biosynthesis